MVGRSTGGRDPNHSDKRNLIVDEFRDKPARDERETIVSNILFPLT